MTNERPRHRDPGARRDRTRESDKDEKKRSRPPRTRYAAAATTDDEMITPENTPRSARRRSRSQSQAPPRGLSADALAALNAQDQRQRQSSRMVRSRDASRGPPRASRESRRVAAGAKEKHRGEEYRSKAYRADPYREPSSKNIRDSREYRDPSQYYGATAAADGRRGNRDETREDRQARRAARAARAAKQRYESEADRWNVTEEYDDEDDESRRKRKKGKRRVVSGAIMEEGMAATVTRGGRVRGGVNRPESEEYMLDEKEIYKQGSFKPGKQRWNKKRIILLGSIIGILLIILIVVAVMVSKKKSGGASTEESDIENIDKSSIPDSAQGTYLDPFTWYDTTDFNLTYTGQMVGNLPVMGLFDDWDDSTSANSRVPPLDKAWGSYVNKPARGVNVGGWLNIEPFITPSLFQYDASEGVRDEWTLCEHLGVKAQEVLERHYATFVTEQTFAAIADAGLDHVRIPYGYWAVETYDGDPYVFRTSWRYLLRGIEWARKYGLRVNLDIHGLPGSQNGWNHSGRQGAIGWLNGTDGDLNGQRSLDIHDRLSKFFAQDRYKNIIAFYGLANEPKMTSLVASDVISWTEKAYAMVKKNGLDAIQVFGDGFMGLDNWQGQLTGYDDLALDVHQYVIFNVNQVVFTHQQKIQYACNGWSKQSEESMDTSTGYGPTLFAEWSQADTDCAKHLNNVGVGSRWDGTYNPGDGAVPVLSPRCPTQDDSCTCSDANADPSRWSADYKKFLKIFAEAQMYSFEKGWGWWYWTWETESAPQWSYKAGLAAGVLPEKAYDRDFNCDSDVPDFAGLPEYY